MAKYDLIRNPDDDWRFCPICGIYDDSLKHGHHHCSESFLRNRERGLKSAETVMEKGIEADGYGLYGDRLKRGFAALRGIAV